MDQLILRTKWPGRAYGRLKPKTMTDAMLDVRAFMNEFGQTKSVELYSDLVREELEELLESEPGMHRYKEAADLIFVVAGLLESFNLDVMDVENMFRAVCTSNMSKASDNYEIVQNWIEVNKLDARVETTKSGRYIAVDNKSNKILKGPSYVAATLTYNPY